MNKIGIQLRRQVVVADDNDRNGKRTQKAVMRKVIDEPAHSVVDHDLFHLVVAHLPKDAIGKKSDLDQELMIGNFAVMEKRLQHTEALPGAQFDTVFELHNLLVLVGLDKPIGIQYRNATVFPLGHFNSMLKRLDRGLGKINRTKDLPFHNRILLQS